MQGCQQPRPASLMARIRAKVSNSPCNISHLAYITFATKRLFLYFLFAFINKGNKVRNILTSMNKYVVIDTESDNQKI